MYVFLYIYISINVALYHLNDITIFLKQFHPSICVTILKGLWGLQPCSCWHIQYINISKRFVLSGHLTNEVCSLNQVFKNTRVVPLFDKHMLRKTSSRAFPQDAFLFPQCTGSQSGWQTVYSIIYQPCCWKKKQSMEGSSSFFTMEIIFPELV